MKIVIAAFAFVLLVPYNWASAQQKNTNASTVPPTEQACLDLISEPIKNSKMKSFNALSISSEKVLKTGNWDKRPQQVYVHGVAAKEDTCLKAYKSAESACLKGSNGVSCHTKVTFGQLLMSVTCGNPEMKQLTAIGGGSHFDEAKINAGKSANQTKMCKTVLVLFPDGQHMLWQAVSNMRR